MKYRYEIKIPISKFNENIFSKWMLSLKNLSVQNQSREINNIYYDTINFESAKNNLDGVSNRSKYRARWYVQNRNYSQCNLEIKIKKSKLNKKIIIPININYKDILGKDLLDLVKDELQKNKINDRNLYIQKFFPTVQNRYKRDYYEWEKIRLTYDTNVNYKNLRIRSLNDWKKDNLNVLEVKFNENKLKEASDLIAGMPFIPKRHSKYLRGLSHCKMAIYI